MRASPTAAVVFVAMFIVAGCAQTPSPTAPSASVTAPASAQVTPVPYDASGTWHVSVVISSISGEVLLTAEGDPTFTADSDGNLRSVNEEEGTQTTLIRRGPGFGPKITYAASSFEPSSSGCPEDLSGIAQIDVATNTLTARLTGVLEGCQNNTVVMSITATKTGV